jgi:hypothetical protein
MAFAGVSLIVDGKLCDLTSSPFDAGVDSGYHLLVVQGYSRTKDTTPNGEFISSRPFLIGGHRWIVKYYPNGKDDDDDNEKCMSLILESDDDGVIYIVIFRSKYVGVRKNQVNWMIDGRKSMGGAPSMFGRDTYILLGLRPIKASSKAPRCFSQ